MTKLSEAKILGGVGSILVLLNFVPQVGTFLGIVGFILTLIAIKFISDFVGDREIFSNMLIAVVLGIVALAVAGILIVGGLLAFFGIQGLGQIGAGTPPNINQGNIVGLLVAIIPGLLAFWVLMIISAFFIRRSYREISVRINVRLFDTAALIYLIGAITTIILIGLILIFIAEILWAIAFFSINETGVAERPAQTA